MLYNQHPTTEESKNIESCLYLEVES